MQCVHAKGDRRWQGIRTATARRLRRDAPVCYKRYMRKWMRERMTRRKKGDGSTPKEQTNAPIPLQPKYFEASEPAPEPPAAVSQADGEPEPAPQPEAERHPAAPTSEGRPAERPSRRRRGRGLPRSIRVVLEALRDLLLAKKTLDAKSLSELVKKS